MNDLPDEDEDRIPDSPRKTSSLAWLVVFLIFFFVVIEIVSMQYTHTNSKMTFSRIGSSVK
ncbi:MAG: hypothetical protein K8U57_15915 [Planctomycetes bacterium]|nr:hypothetical protein [Planctomycetota bacterium]